MAQLIQMRNRIRAVETIKKITHAMRLIAMSTHSRLQEHRTALQAYKQEVTRLFISLHVYDQSWKSRVLNPKQDGKHLVILVGSQKGLCGNFNENLFRYFEKTYNQSHARHAYEVVAVGEKAVDYCTQQKLHLVNTFKIFTTRNITPIADAVASHIMEATPSYSTVTLFGNYPKTFFVQKSHKSMIIPADLVDFDKQPLDLSEYVWEQSPTELLDYLVHVYLKVTIEHGLFESLMAEQAARFISMDSSTRNAEDVLEDLNLQYNKTRQAKITRELAELTGSY